MTSNPFQKRDRGGRFDFDTHAEPGIGPLTAQPSETTRQSLSRREELARRAAELQAEIAIESAAALASHTRDVFPDAEYLEITADDVHGNGARVTGIRGPEDRLLARRGGSSRTPSEVYSRWASMGRGEESTAALTADLQGRLDHLGEAATLTSKPREGNFGVYAGGCTFTLDIDKALEASSRRTAA